MYNFLLYDILAILLGIFLSFLITTFLLDNFQFSRNRIISILQKTLFILILLFIILYFLYIYNYNVIECMSDRSITDINNSYIDPNLTKISDKSKNELSVSGNLTGVLNLNREAGQEIAKGISIGASNIGLGASIGGVATAAAKVATGSPIQKLAIVGLGAVTGGMIHVAATTSNRAISDTMINNNSNTNIVDSTPPSPISPSSIYESSLFESLYNSNNPVESLILSIQLLQIISLALIFLLIVNLFFKYIGNYKFEFKFIDNLLQPYNTRLKMILQNIINIWSKSSTINIILIIVLLLITTFASIYYMGILINHFEDFIHLYLKYINK